MSIYLTNRPCAPDEVAKLAGDLMGNYVTLAEPISKGANNRVYRLRSSTGDSVIKFYFQHPSDPRDRLGTEFKSLSFLWAQGFRQIPKPLNAWPQHACALYSLVDGVTPAGQRKDQDIDQVIDFLKTLNGFSKSPDSKGLPLASEAFFSPLGIADNIKGRLKRFNFENQQDEYRALHVYLHKEFLPLLAEIESWSKACLKNQGIPWDQDLLEKYRTLSPCDFGFHNALRSPQGAMFFLDFEYFGWDDPVKMVADFLWHPAMSLTEDCKARFIHRMQSVFNDDQAFKTRLKALSPLFGLKWCLIILNEFVNVDMQRRGFSGMATDDQAAIRLRQLAKARDLSQRVGNSYNVFSWDR